MSSVSGLLNAVDYVEDPIMEQRLALNDNMKTFEDNMGNISLNDKSPYQNYDSYGIISCMGDVQVGITPTPYRINGNVIILKSMGDITIGLNSNIGGDVVIWECAGDISISGANVFGNVFICNTVGDISFQNLTIGNGLYLGNCAGEIRFYGTVKIHDDLIIDDVRGDIICQRDSSIRIHRDFLIVSDFSPDKWYSFSRGLSVGRDIRGPRRFINYIRNEYDLINDLYPIKCPSRGTDLMSNRPNIGSIHNATINIGNGNVSVTSTQITTRNNVIQNNSIIIGNGNTSVQNNTTSLSGRSNW